MIIKSFFRHTCVSKNYNMRRYIFYLILILSSANLRGQGVFAPTGATWYFNQLLCYSGVTYNRYTSLGDTIINSHLCKKIERMLPVNLYSGNSDTSTFLFYVYSDSNIVYCSYGSTFWVLYDFNKNSGEYWINDEIQDTVYVDSVKTTIIDGDSLKMLYIHNAKNEWYVFSGIVIEKIGWTRHFYTVLGDSAPPAWGELRCYSDDSISYIVDSLCDYMTPGVNVNDFVRNEQIKIFPNPTNDFIKINFSNSKIITIEISDINGQLLFIKKMISSDIIDLSNYSNGIYFLKIISDNFTTTNKILKY